MTANDSSLVGALVAQLFEPPVERRREASEKLFRLGKAATSAIPYLVRATKDEDNVVRFNAIAALGSTGASGQEVVQSLVDVLRAPIVDSGLRLIAAVKLGQLGPAAEAFLIDSLHHPDRVVRKVAADGLRQGRFDRALAVPHLVQLLDDSDEDVRSCAAGTLAEIGPQAFPHLERVIGTKTGDAVCHAARALLTSMPGHQPAIRALVAQLDDRDPAVRRHAAWFLQYAGPHGGAAVQRLIEALEDDDPKVRSFAAGTLGDIGLPSKGAEPALVKSLRQDAPDVRCSSAYALGELRAASPATVEALAEAAHDQYRDVQVAAILALEKIGALARAAVPSLRRALVRTADDPEMQARITESLRSIAEA
jgi:HEAT repeat protein